MTESNWNQLTKTEWDSEFDERYMTKESNIHRKKDMHICMSVCTYICMDGIGIEKYGGRRSKPMMIDCFSCSSEADDWLLYYFGLRCSFLIPQLFFFSLLFYWCPLRTYRSHNFHACRYFPRKHTAPLGLAHSQNRPRRLSQTRPVLPKHSVWYK